MKAHLFESVEQAAAIVRSGVECSPEI